MYQLVLAPLLTILSLPVYTANTLVETTSGSVRGFTRDVDGSNVYTYLGIPFAEPPIGNLRFRRPVPMEKWTDVYNATSRGNSCVQMPFESFQDKKGKKSEDVWNPNTPMNEDCLHLNIWVPEVIDGSKLTTLIWIYGGGFVTGSSALDIYDGALMAALQRVIVISVNYRVGPLGFFYLGTDEAPGNMGLLDQQLALHWIHANIDRFGGSANDLVLFGESAGAASVGYHVMANNSRDLFHSIIMQSGAPASNWAFNDPDISMKYAHELAVKFGCDSDDNLAVVNCLRNTDAKELSTRMFYLPITPTTFNFVPTVDNHFIYESPLHFLNSGKIPSKKILLGVNRNEAMYFLFYGMYVEMNWPNNFLQEDDFDTFLPLLLSKNGIDKLDSISDKLLLDAVLNRYLGPLLPGDTKNYVTVLDDISE